MLCFPTASVLVVKVATPLPFNVPVPSCFVLSKKVTVPVGSTPLPTIVAVNVTDVPETIELADDDSVTVGVALFTVRTTLPAAVV